MDDFDSFDEEDLEIDQLEALREQAHLLRVACEMYDRGDLRQAKVIADRVYCICHDRGEIRTALSRLNLKRSMRFFSTLNTSFFSEFRGASNGNLYVDVTIKERGESKRLGLELAVICIPEARAPFRVFWAPRFEDLRAPKLDDLSYLRSTVFDEWWAEVIFSPGGDYALTRREFVRIMRCRESSHIDRSVRSQSYAMLRNKGSRHITSVEHDDGVGVTLFASRFRKQSRVHVVPTVSATPPDLRGKVPQPIPYAHLATMRQIGWELDWTIRYFLRM